MKRKQTAIEWLVKQVNSDCLNSTFIRQDLIEQAKAMEKEQIMRSHSSGYNSGLENKIVLSYEYYIKTFKSE